MTSDELRAVDRSGMHDRLMHFPDQVREAVAIGRGASFPWKARGTDAIVLCGLGGSAIAGDLLRSYLAADLAVPFLVNRTYTLPAFVGPRTLVIISSYSGNTEETNAAQREALRRRARILCITSGGSTAALARKRRTPLILVPGGSPPRAALGYAFFPLFIALSSMGFISDRRRDIAETIRQLEERAAEYGDPSRATNAALLLARQFQGRIGVIYSSAERFDSVNTRWRGQIAENAKTLVFGNVLPEMNHNELVGWKVLREQMREIQVLFLRDKGDHPRVQARMEITRGVIGTHTPHVAECWSRGTSLLARMFSLIVLGDWVSYYLAILHGEDPTPVEVIDRLKRELANL
jgi:glucose/mannose-6-phosphate isomerase